MDTARFAKLILMWCLHEVLAAVLYPASSCKPKPAGTDGICQERPHLGHALLSARLCSGFAFLRSDLFCHHTGVNLSNILNFASIHAIE